jgi:hypothetical protein
MPSKTDSKAFTRAESGMKVTCGFEMLVTDSQYQDRPAAREIKMTLDDLDSGDETLPSDADIESWDKREDEEKWLDISFDDLEQELGGSKAQASKSKRDFGDKAAQENLQRIVKQFEEFLNDDKAGPEGAGMFDDSDEMDDDLDGGEDDSDDEGEDKDASFDEDEFTKMMQEMMGMPPEVMKEIMSGKLGNSATDPANRAGLRPAPTGPGHVEDSEDEEEEEDAEDAEDMQKFMEQMEAELRGTGVLNLGSSSKSSAGKQAAIQPPRTGKVEELDDNEEYELSSDDDIDNQIDVNLAKNLLESLKSQAGTAGPGGNLMGMLGLGMMPRDEPDAEGDDDHVQAGPSGTKR